MMTKIKFAIAFILGAVYYWSASYFLSYYNGDGVATPLGVISGFILIFGGVGIIMAVIIFLADNWKKP